MEKDLQSLRNPQQVSPPTIPPGMLTDRELVSHAEYHLFMSSTLPPAWQHELLSRFTRVVDTKK